MSGAERASDAVTRLVESAAGGDRDAADRLLPVVYEQLRSAARRQLSMERNGNTLSPTALVHEAYLKLVGPRRIPWANRRHFYAAAAEAMRRILVDRARAKAAGVRGGPKARRAALSLAAIPDPESATDSAGFLMLDDAFARLEQVDSEAAAVVRFRYFAGLSVAETAAAMGVSTATIGRLWTFARAWLREALESDGE